MAFKKIAHEHHLTASAVSKLMTRCLGGEYTTPPPLTKGLIPYQRIKLNTRKTPLSTILEPKGPQNSFFELLNQVPNIRFNLDRMLKASHSDKPYAQNITPAILHGEFKRVLAEENWPMDRYPYTEESLAYESVRRYYHKQKLAFEVERLNKKIINLKMD